MSSNTTTTQVRLVDIFPEMNEANLLVHRSHSSEVRQVTWHRHRQGELLWATTGALRVSTLHGTWVLPPSQAMWLPGNEPHEVNYLRDTDLRAYLPNQKFCPQLPQFCCPVKVTGALRKTLQIANSSTRWLDAAPETQRLMSCLFEEIQDNGVLALSDPFAHYSMPHPATSALRPMADALRSRGNDAHSDTHKSSPNTPYGAPRDVQHWAEYLGLNARTLSRTLKRETGMSYLVWRRQIRLIHALELLALGDTGAEVARKLGYRSVGMFRTLFRRYLGKTPAEYFQ